MIKNNILSNKPYKQLAKYYDGLTNLDVLTTYKSIIGEIKDLYMLDLGCGTGTLLKYYSSKNKTYGIDEMPEMIKIAKAKDKNTHYSIGDIKNFKIDKKFDVITCAFDTINHLSSLNEWEQLFKTVSINLSVGGMFIFDFNTIDGFNNYSYQTIFKQIGKDYFLMRAKTKGEICFWMIDGFTKESTGLFKHAEFIIKERSYPKNLIIKTVEKYFSIVDTLDQDNNRIYIKARKRATQ